MVVVLRPVAEVAGQVDELVAELQIEIEQLAPGTIVEHVGATALPTGVTKGDVDVAIAVPVDDFDALVRTLERHYEVAQPHNWTDTYASFSAPGRALPAGIQVAVMDSTDDFLVPLRELMLTRPDLLAAYTECKSSAAHLGDAGYWEAKNRFLHDVFVEHLPWARPARGSR